jgi:histidyl-tRNA synthetase
LDYYTGLVFEVFDKHPENKRAICGGGAYANLLQIFNEPPMPGIGFGMGDVTLTDFLETHNLLPKEFSPNIDLICAYLSAKAEPLAWKLANDLRKQQIKVELMLGDQKPKKVFQLAEHKKHHYAIILGDQEVDSGQIELKNLKTKESFKFLNDSALIKNILQKISSGA